MAIDSAAAKLRDALVAATAIVRAIFAMSYTRRLRVEPGLPDVADLRRFRRALSIGLSG